MKFYIVNKEYFEEIIEKGTSEYKTLWRNLFNGEYDIENEILSVLYDDWGSAQFEVLSHGPIWLKLEFIGTTR